MLFRSQGRTGEDSYLSKFKASLSPDKPVEPEVLDTDEIKVPETVIPAEPVVSTESEPVVLSPGQLHENRVKRASNKAVIDSLNETGLRKIINDYYWTDVSQTHDIATELGSSDNAMTDLNQYVDRIKGMITHWPNATYRENMISKLDNAMMQTYAKKSESEKKVSAAEARVRDSEEFLRSLDLPTEASPAIEL